MRRSFILILCIFLLSGCLVRPRAEKDKNDYSYQYFASSSTGYDYSTLIDTNWIQTNDSIVEDDLYHFLYDGSDIDLYIMKDKSILGEERRNIVQVDELVDELNDEMIRLDINPDLFLVEKTQKDYYGSYKFLKESGTYAQRNYIRIYFQAEYTIPSVTGQLLTNCCLVLYDDEEMEIAENTITVIEKSIEYR